MSLQRKIYERLAGLIEAEVEDRKDLRYTRAASRKIEDRAEKDRRERERQQRASQQNSSFEPEGEELSESYEVCAYNGSKLLGKMPAEKSDIDDSIEAVKNLYKNSTKIVVKSKGKEIKSVKVK